MRKLQKKPDAEKEAKINSEKYAFLREKMVEVSIPFRVLSSPYIRVVASKAFKTGDLQSQFFVLQHLGSMSSLFYDSQAVQFYSGDLF